MAINVGDLLASLELDDNLTAALAAPFAALENLGPAIDKLNDALLKLDKTLSDSADEHEKTAQSSLTMGAAIAVGEKAVDMAIGAVRELAGALPEAVMGTLALADNMTNLADRTGIGVEALQAMGFAGAAVGVSTDTIATSMYRLQRSLGEGDGIDGKASKAAQALTRLGISMRDFKSLSPEAQLTTIVTKLSEMGDVSERNALAVTLLGRNAGPALATLGKGLAEAMQRAKDLNTVISKDSIAAADALGDNIGELERAFDGLKNRFGESVTGSQAVSDAVVGLTQIVADLSRFVQANETDIRGLVENGLVVFLQATAVAIEALTVFIGLLQLGVTAYNSFGKAVDDATLAGMQFSKWIADKTGDEARVAAIDKNIEAFKQQSSELRAGSEKAEASLKLFAEAGQKTAVAVLNLSEKLGTGAVKATSTSEQFERAAQAALKLAESSGKAASELQKAADAIFKGLSGQNAAAEMAAIGMAMNRLGDLSRASTPELEKLRSSLVKLDAEGAKGAAEGLKKVDAELAKRNNTTAYAEETKRIIKALDDMSAQADKTSKELRDLENSMQGLQSAEDSTKLNNLVETFKRLEAAGKTMTAAGLKPLIDALTAAAQRGQLTAEQFGILDRAMKAVADSTAEERAELEAVARQEGVVAEATKAAADATRRHAEAMQQIQSIASGVVGVLGQLSSVMDSLGIAADSATRSFVDSAVASVTAVATLARGIASGDPSAIASGISSLMAAGAARFRGVELEIMGQQIGTVLGTAVGQGVVEAIEQTMNDLDISFIAATLLQISAALEDTGNEARTMIGPILQLMEGISNGSIPAREGMAELGDLFGQVAQEAQEAGRVGDAALVAILQQARQLGGAFYTPEMRQFVETALNQAITGLDLLIGRMNDAGEISGGLLQRFMSPPTSGSGDAAGVVGIPDQSAEAAAAASDVATIFMATFNAVLAERGILAAVEALQPSFDALRAQFTEMGDTAALAALAPYERLSALAGNDIFRGAAESAEGVRQIMSGLADAGYLDIATFEALERTAVRSFDGMIAGGATTREAILTMAPTIQAAISASEQFGVPLDADMARLRALAEQNGITFRTDPMERMVAILAAIATFMGVTLPASAAATSSSLAGVGASASAAAASTSQGFDAVRDGFDAVRDGVDAVSDGFEAVGTQSSTTFEGVDSVLGQTSNSAAEFATLIGDNFSSSFETVSEAASSASGVVGESFSEAFYATIESGQDASGTLEDAFFAVQDAGEEAANRLSDDFTEQFAEIDSSAEETFLDVQSYIDGLEGREIPITVSYTGPGDNAGEDKVQRFGTGGFFPGRPGGYVANIGEAGDEWVLNREQMGSFMRLAQGQGQGQGQGSISIGELKLYGIDDPVAFANTFRKVLRDNIAGAASSAAAMLARY